MKNILLNTLIAVIAVSCSAQTVYDINTPADDVIGRSYFRRDINNYFDTVIGSWSYQTSSQSLTMTFEKRPDISISGGSKHVDGIVGNYIYTENGIVISETNEIGNWENFKVFMSFTSPTEYYMILRDVTSQRTYTGTFQLLSNTTAKVTLYPIQGTLINMNYNGDFRLPTSFILTKI